MHTLRPFVPVLAALALLMPAAAPVSAQAGTGADAIRIPYQEFTLPNGLRVLVHEDHKAPIVAVNIWYHVGSKNEPDGRSGFAHLFEHLMFNGSEHYNQDYFKAMERIGATDLNGTTNEDRTNYFQNVPTTALDVPLFLESDRMGHLLPAIDQPRLDEQRGVVQNEKRQGENQPYGMVYDYVTPRLYPPGHPYHHSVIGSMEDLDAAKLENVKDWFRTYYGPNNAVLVLAGDIDSATAHAKALRFFGDIPPGPPTAKATEAIARRTGTERGVMQDRVPQARVYKWWNIPGFGTAEAASLDLVTDLLAAGKTSRLYKRLVYDEQIATNVSAFVDLREIGGLLNINALVAPGKDLAAVERAIDEELTKLLADGPTAEEVARVQTQFRANFIRGIERIGGFGGKSDVLAQCAVYTGDPACYQTRLGRVAAATPSSLRDAARRWLADGAYVLEVRPFPNLVAQAQDLDRSALPTPLAPPAPRFPTVQRATLSNGLQVILAERRSVPKVEMRLLVDAGFAADQGGLPGTSSMAIDMMDEGTTTRNALQISEQLAMLGATLGTGADLDMSTVSLSALKDRLDGALALFTDVVLNPAFPVADLERLQAQRLAAIQREKVQPLGLALRVFPQLLYGEGHAYATSFTGSGTEDAVRQITRQALQEFHRRWFRPNNATLVVVGDVTMSELRPKLERAFGGWQRGQVPVKNLATVGPQAQSTIFLLDRPGAQQSIIFAGNLAPPKANPDELAIEVMNGILGGNFTSRVNMNLREDKHWSYGAFTLLLDAKGQRPFILYAPVQTDKTKESVQESLAELQGILGSRPVQAAEVELASAALTQTLPGRWETMSAVAGSITEQVTFGLADDYWDTYADRIRTVNASGITTAAAKTIQPGQLVWVVVGDRAKVEAGLRELGIGEVRLLDADGKPIDRRPVP